MNWLTIVVIVFVLVMMLIGMKRGLVRMLVSVATVFVTILLCSILREPVEGLLKDKTPIYSSVEKGVSEFAENAVKAAGVSGNISAENVIGQLPLPEIIRDRLMESYGQTLTQKVDLNSLENYLKTWLTDVVFTAIAYICTFLIAFIVVRIAALILVHAARLPLLRQVNSFAGALLGLLLALVLLWVGGLVVTSFAAEPWGQEALRLIKESPVLSYIYNHNLLFGTFILPENG